MEEKNEDKSAESASMEKWGGKENSQYTDETCRRKIKNYISIVILLAGLLIGSVFVDVAQFFGQQGVSPRVLKNVDVFPFEGRTWVAYNEPVVNLQILTANAKPAIQLNLSNGSNVSFRRLLLKK